MQDSCLGRFTELGEGVEQALLDTVETLMRRPAAQAPGTGLVIQICTNEDTNREASTHIWHKNGWLPIQFLPEWFPAY